MVNIGSGIMNTKMFDAIYNYYKEHYEDIEKRELYKWKAVVHFQDNWNIDAKNFSEMLENALKKISNLMSAGNYYPRKIIVWATKKEPEKVRDLFRQLYDLSIDLKERMVLFRDGIDEIVEKHKEGKVSKSFQDPRAIMGLLFLLVLLKKLESLNNSTGELQQFYIKHGD